MNYTEDNLQKQKAKELMKLATSLGVKGSWTMKKAEVIKAILAILDVQNQNPATPDEDSANNVPGTVDVPIESEEDKVERIQAKLEYVETAPIGSLIAFYAPDGKVRTAKITKRSVKNQKLKVQTEYKAEYIVTFTDVLWVRTGTRWPRGVYNLLKGIKNDGKGESNS